MIDNRTRAEEDNRKLHEHLNGRKGFLIPLEVLSQSHFKMFDQPGHYCAMKVTGSVIEVEGQKYFEVETWKV